MAAQASATAHGGGVGGDSSNSSSNGNSSGTANTTSSLPLPQTQHQSHQGSSPSSRVPTPAPLADSSAAMHASPAAVRVIRRSGAAAKSSWTVARQADPLSDRATEAMVRRVLCPSSSSPSSQQQQQQQPATSLGGGGRAAAGGAGASSTATSTTPPPIDSLLPPLTSRNDVDLQLYALLAIVLREFVQSWYGRITPDEEFVAEIVRIVAHCTRALESRLRRVDLESLLFDELPELVLRHFEAYRVTHRSIVRPPVEADPRDAYHALIPLPALSPVPRPSSRSIEEQCVNERAYRTLLVQGALAVLLPTEDLENECLTSLVGQIFSETVIGGVVANKASEPWVIWTGLTLLADIIRKNTSSKAVSRVGKSTKDATAATTTSTKAQTGWHDDAKDLPDAAGGQGGQGGGITARAQRMLWFAIHCLFLAISAMRVLVRTVVVSRSLPSRLYRSIGPKGDMSGHSSDGRQSIDAAMMREQARPPQLLLPPHALAKQPVLEFKVWACMASVIELDARMPWLAGSLSMLQWLLVNAPGRIAAMDGILDRLLSHAIETKVIGAAQRELPGLLRALRGAIFPNNAPPGKQQQGQTGPQPVIEKTPEELRALKRRCAKAWLDLVPRKVWKVYLGSPRDDAGSLLRTGPPGTQVTNKAEDDDEDEYYLSEIEEGILDVFGDAYCNKHLMYSILELVLVRIMPELAEKSVVELWDERLS